MKNNTTEKKFFYTGEIELVKKNLLGFDFEILELGYSLDGVAGVSSYVIDGVEVQELAACFATRQQQYWGGLVSKLKKSLILSDYKGADENAGLTID